MPHLSSSRSSKENNDVSLTPPLAILDHIQILREIMNVYQSSLIEDDESGQAAGFEKILDIMVDPAIEMITRSNKEPSRLGTKWDQPIYALNCLCYIKTALESFSFTREKEASINALIDERVSSLIEEHVRVPLCSTFKPHIQSEPLSRIPLMQPSELQVTLRNFSLWLSSPDVVQSPRLSQLTVQHLHAKIHQTALERMVRAYGLICEEVKRPENKYEAASTLLGSERPFGQIHLLRQILGITDEYGEVA
ncbi:hypothetical protein C0989_008344 [Termitomyces sp. Mn162]|nr:hypothetical protein C0989_008344 [Termitomyces sp. Mn162]